MAYNTPDEEIADLKKQLAQQRASSTAVINVLVGDLEQLRLENDRLRAALKPLETSA